MINAMVITGAGTDGSNQNGRWEGGEEGWWMMVVKSQPGRLQS